MRVLILNWRDPKNPQAGGAEVSTLKIAQGLIESGHKVIWVSFSFKNAKSHEVIGGVEYLRPARGIFLFLYVPIYYLANRGAIDFVIDEVHGLGFFTCLYVRKPKIVYIHEVAGEIWKKMYPLPIALIGQMVEKYMFKMYKNTNFLTVSRSTKMDLIRMGIDPKFITIIKNGTQGQLLSSVKKEKNPTFIFVSRLVKMKGIEDVIEAFRIILYDMPESNLWIVGGGDKNYLQELKEIAIKNGIDKKIKFFGFVDESKRNLLLRRSHILLHASIKEGWGLVVIEAARQKTPAIVYRSSGLVDSVINNKTGIILKKNNPKSMAIEAIKLMKNKELYEKISAQTYDYSMNFDWGRTKKLTSEYIERMANFFKKQI